MSKTDVTFKSGSDMLSGNLYLPEGFDENSTYPTIIYSGPMTQIKEQTGAFYGPKFAAKGFVFMAFDHSGYGESEGPIRCYENPPRKMENIRDAISYLGTLSYVNREHLYGLGICASGCTMALVAMTDKRLKALATVSGYMNNTANFYQDMPREQIVGMMQMANAARQKAYETDEMTYMDVMGMDTMDTDAMDEHSVLRNAHDFYMTDRGGKNTHPRYEHHNSALFFEIYPQANAQPIAPYLYTPYLGIYGDKAMLDSAPLTIDFYNACSEPKELFEVQGANHVDLYDKDEFVDQAVKRITEFYGKHQDDAT